MADSYPMTPKGLLSLKEELKFRKEVERPKIVRAIEEARAHGDLSENAEYTAAKEAQSLNEGRIGKVEEMIALANVIDPAGLSGSKVVFGVTVTIEDGASGEQQQRAWTGMVLRIRAGEIGMSFEHGRRGFHGMERAGRWLRTILRSRGGRSGSLRRPRNRQ